MQEAGLAPSMQPSQSHLTSNGPFEVDMDADQSNSE
jgi:hypothetical protein